MNFIDFMYEKNDSLSPYTHFSHFFLLALCMSACNVGMQVHAYPCNGVLHKF